MLFMLGKKKRIQLLHLLILQDNVFVHIVSSILYKVIKHNADDAFYELQNPREQIQAYVFDGAHFDSRTFCFFDSKSIVKGGKLGVSSWVMGESRTGGVDIKP